MNTYSREVKIHMSEIVHQPGKLDVLIVTKDVSVTEFRRKPSAVWALSLIHILRQRRCLVPAAHYLESVYPGHVHDRSPARPDGILYPVPVSYTHLKFLLSAPGHRSFADNSKTKAVGAPNSSSFAPTLHPTAPNSKRKLD